MLHIQKGIKADRHPDDRDKGHKQFSDRIDPKINRNSLHQLKETHLMLTAPRREQRKHRRKHKHDADETMQSSTLFFLQIVPYIDPAAAQMASE